MGITRSLRALLIIFGLPGLLSVVTACGSTADGSDASSAGASAVANDGDDSRAPNPCSLLKSEDVRSALELDSDADKVWGSPAGSVRHNDFGESWARPCTVTLDDEDHGILTITVQQFDGPANAAASFEKSSGWADGQLVDQKKDVGIGDRSQLTYLRASNAAEVLWLHNNVVVSVNVPNIRWPNGHYFEALTSLGTAADGRL